jgi:hydroxyethylthiazole kinase-like uncharacterized protein yjeF
MRAIETTEWGETTQWGMRAIGTTQYRNTRLLVTAEQMREMDRRATEEYGIPSLLLMENAGKAVADAAAEFFDGVFGSSILVVCGPGNNGGDGFVAARHLRNAKAHVTIFYFGDRASAKGDALANIEMAEKMGIPIDYSKSIKHLSKEISHCDYVIDALLGTGARGDLKPEYAKVVKVMNHDRGDAHLIAVDIPSGLDADTGRELGPVGVGWRDYGKAAVNADMTVTLGLPKVGLVTYPGAGHVGHIVVADIGIPAAIYHGLEPAAKLLGRGSIIGTGLGVARDADSHKGTYGHVAIVAGSVGLTGAATLAAMGALRIGTGLVTVLVPESLNDIMEVKLTEAMTIPVPEGKARAFGMASLDKVLEYVNKWDSAVIGPGFGRDEDTIEFTLKLIRKLTKPAIIDADALYAVSRDLSVLKKCKAPLVITPHPGEMATLLGTTSDQVQSNRLETARSFAKEHGVTVVLKGAGTVIAEPDGSAFINTTGSPGMATGGTGDVLSGMIGGLLAQGSGHAANAAVYLHGRAGEIAAEKLGEAAMIASDVADSIGKAIQEVLQEPDSKE